MGFLIALADQLMPLVQFCYWGLGCAFFVLAIKLMWDGVFSG